jgi:acyl-coenzyme A thioesterase PaaI-like protein
MSMAPPDAAGRGRRAALIARLDEAMARAAQAHAGAGFDAAAIDLHVSFVRHAAAHTSVQARVCGGGRSVCFCEAEATDGDGQVVARALGTFRRGAAPAPASPL